MKEKPTVSIVIINSIFYFKCKNEEKNLIITIEIEQFRYLEWLLLVEQKKRENKQMKLMLLIWKEKQTLFFCFDFIVKFWLINEFALS